MEPKQPPRSIKIGKKTILQTTEAIERDASVFLPPSYLKQNSDDDEETNQNESKATDAEEANSEDTDQPDFKPTDEEAKLEEHETTGGLKGGKELFYKWFNTRALPEDATTYCLEKFDKNALIILNHVKVEGYDKIRQGSNEDAAALEITFAKFGFEIERHDDLRKLDVIKKLKEFSSRDFTDYGCVAVAVLTHGTNNGLLRANDLGQFYSEMDILKHFKSRSKPTLFSKPVVLMIQACRGTSNTRGVVVGTSTRIARDHDEEELEQYHLPLECDILVVNSSYHGKSSYRPADGSWFIQTVCKRINELYKTHDLEAIMLNVKREVATKKYNAEYNTATDDMEVNTQMPVVTSTLIRKLHLFDKSDSSNLVSLTASDAWDVNDGPKYIDEIDGPKYIDEIDGPSGGRCKLCKNNNKIIKNDLWDHDRFSLKNSLVTWSQSFTIRSIGLCIGVCVMYNLVARHK